MLSRVEITYSFAGFDAPVSTCAEAGVSQLVVLLESLSAEEVYGAPCEDAVVVLADVEPGDWELVVRDVELLEEHTGPYVSSVPQDITVYYGETTEVAVTLGCEENGVDGGCSGSD